MTLTEGSGKKRKGSEGASVTHIRNKEKNKGEERERGRRGEKKGAGAIREESVSNGQIILIEETPPLLGLHLRALFQTIFERE